MKSLQMQSCVHSEGTIECALFEVDIPAPGDNEVMVKIEASPINPSDLGLMFGAADVNSIRASERNGHPSIVLDVPAPPCALWQHELGSGYRSVTRRVEPL